MAIRTFRFNQIRKIFLNAEHLEIRLMQENDRVKAQNFLRKHFYKNDPLLVLLDLHNSHSGVEAYDKYLEDAIKSELSLMMLNHRNEIVALSMNRIMNRNDKSYRFKDQRCQKFAFLVEAIDEKCNLFNKFGVDRYLKLDVLAADPMVHNGGIQKKLLDMTKNFAHIKNIKLIRFDATGYYNAKDALNLGFEPIYSLNYNNYVLNDVPIFKLPHPNSDYSVFVQTIEKKQPELERMKRRKPSIPNITFSPISKADNETVVTHTDMRRFNSIMKIQNLLKSQKYYVKYNDYKDAGETVKNNNHLHQVDNSMIYTIK